MNWATLAAAKGALKWRRIFVCARERVGCISSTIHIIYTLIGAVEIDPRTSIWRRKETAGLEG